MKPSFLLTMDATQWHVVRVADGETECRAVSAADPAAACQSAAEALRELGYLGEPIALGLSWHMVFGVEIDCALLPRRGRRQAMLFALEEQLPLNAEDLTAEFVMHNGKAFGVAVRTQHVKNLVAQLEAKDVLIGAVHATALLAAWHELKSLPGCELAVVPSGNETDILRFSDGRPIAWHHCDDDADAIVQTLNAELLRHPAATDRPAVLSLGQPLELGDGFEVRHAPHDALTSAAPAIANGDQDAGWANLRTGQLSSGGALDQLARPIAAAWIAALALLTVLAAAFYTRSAGYSRLAAQCEASQTAEYRELYPAGSIPLNIRSRLESELARLTGLSGESNDVPAQAESLEVLGRIIQALPDTFRLRLTQLRVWGDGVVIEGQVRNHSDAESVCQSLRSAGFDIEPPRTQAIGSGGVLFTISGKSRTALIAAAGEGR